MAGGNFDPYSHQNNDLSTSAGARKFHRSASSSTDDARYVAGNRARQDAARARNASNPSFSGLLQRVFSGDPRARARSTFRNPQADAPGIFGYKGFLRPETGNFLTDASRFTPFNLLTGAINYATTGPRDTGTEYTMNTQSGTGPGVGALTALSNMQNRRLAANRAAGAAYAGRAPAPAAQTGATTPPVAADPLLGYGFEEDKFGFDPQAPRTILDDLDIDLNPGYSQIAGGQYVPSYDPFSASESTSAPSEAALDFDAWLSSDQGQAMANKGLPEKNLRSMHNIYLKLNAGKF